MEAKSACTYVASLPASDALLMVDHLLLDDEFILAGFPSALWALAQASDAPPFQNADTHTRPMDLLLFLSLANESHAGTSVYVIKSKGNY